MVVVEKLSSGVSLVVEELNHVNSVAVGIWTKTGAVNEDEKYSGISHFVEHMMFKGTEKRSPLDIARDVDILGGQMNAFTSKEHTCYYVKVLEESFEKATDVLVDMLENSLFSQEELERERGVILEEMKMIGDDPQDLAMEVMGDRIYAGYNLGKSVIGRPESLGRINKDIMKDYVKKQYTRDSLVVSIAGNVTVERAREYFEKAFEKLEGSKDEIDRKAGKSPDFVQVIEKDIQQSHIVLGKRSSSVKDPKKYPLAIVNNLFGGTMSSRLFQNVRERKGLAYSIYSQINSDTESGYFQIYGGVAHDKIKEAVEGIREELKVLETQKISKEEIDMSKAQIKSSMVFGDENIIARMGRNGRSYIQHGRFIETPERLKKIDAITEEDIEAAKLDLADISTYSAVVCTNRDVDFKGILGR